MNSIKRMLIAGLLAAAAMPSYATGEHALLTDPPGVGANGTEQNTGQALGMEEAAHREWHKQMAQIPTSGLGCFHASYPDYVWEKMDCQSPSNLVHTQPTENAAGMTDTTAAGAVTDVVGGGHDYVVLSPALIGTAIGQFTTKGVKTETGVGVPFYGNGGQLGPNEYSVQLNTNANRYTKACAGHSKCTVWQQFLYVSDATPVTGNGKTGLAFIEYWLVNYYPTAPGTCPLGWAAFEFNCLRFNEHFAALPKIPASDLGKITFTATAMAGANDTLVIGYGSDAYQIVSPDSVVDIATVWDLVEFNVVGNAGGSRADFNSGSSITVDVTLLDGGSTAKCVLENNHNATVGTTGESNNLNLKGCRVIHGAPVPTVQITESN